MRLFRALSLLLLVSSYSFAATPDRIAGAIDSSRMVQLTKSLHPNAQPRYDQGPVDPSRPLSYMTLLMAPSASQQRALNQLLAQQQDPKSSNYHKWLSPQQYAERFGLSQNDLNKITNWLSSQGFQILSVGGGRNTVTFSGTASQVQRAFGTEIHSYRVNAEEHFANSTPLMMPSGFRGIVTSVLGLHDFRMKPANGRRRFSGMRNGRRDYYDGNYIFPNFLAPGDIATIYDISPLYNLPTPIDGTGQKLAVVGQTDIYLADINDFRTGFGLSAIPTSGAGSCSTDVNGIIISPCNTTKFDYVLVGSDLGVFAGDLSESDLDIEWSGAVARNAQIVFVNGGTVAGVTDALVAAINPPSGPPLAPVVSMSYGICEAQGFDMETVLQQGNAEGVTIVNSSGDVGAAGCDRNPPNSSRPFSPAVGGLAVSYPASSPQVTGVGGTEISLADDSFPTLSPLWTTTPDANGGTAVSYIPELAWNDDAELAQYCHAPAAGDTFCSQGGTPAVTGWVPLTTSATAAQVQSDIWISIAGGGASNCFTETSGGVCQAGFPQPTWQQGLSVPGAPAGVRYVPDVALLSSPNFPGYILCTPLSELIQGSTSSTSSCASGIFDAVDTNGSVIGGTSAAAPVFAGILTLVNQYLVKNGFQATPGLGNANPNLYHIATYNQNAFQQVKTGDNIVSCQPHTPSIQPTALQCPAAVAPATAGVIGYKASNSDPATGYNLVNGLGSVDASNLVTDWGELLTASTTSLSRSAANIVEGQSETLTITVTPSSASGVVSLYNNGSTSALTTVTVTGGSGTFTTTSLPVGANSIVGKYTGTNASSTSAAVVVTVAAADFTWSASTPKAHTVLAGQTSRVYTFTATPVGTATFTKDVTFGSSACFFTPADTTLACAFNTGQADPTKIAAGSPATLVQMTITTKGPNTGTGAAVQHRANNRSPWLPLTLPIAGVVLVGVAGRRVWKYSAVAGLCVSLVLLGLLIACGGSSPPITVSVSPASASLYPNVVGATNWPPQTTTFSATVDNTSQKGVSWSISPASSGSIDANGKYTAPATVPSPATVTVTATSLADASKMATATVNIQTPTALGTFNVTVTATEAGTQKQDSVTLTVQ